MTTLIGIERQKMSFADDKGKQVDLDRIHLYFVNDKSPNVIGSSCFVEKIESANESSIFNGGRAEDFVGSPCIPEFYVDRAGKKRLVEIHPLP